MSSTVRAAPGGTSGPLEATRPDRDAFEDVPGQEVPREVTSIVFPDLSRLLRLGEQTGLNDSAAYLAVKDDLQRMDAAGARSTGDSSESTAEILLSIP